MIGQMGEGGEMEAVINKMRVDFALVAVALSWPAADFEAASGAIRAAIQGNDDVAIRQWSCFLADLACRVLREQAGQLVAPVAEQDCRDCAHFRQPGKSDGYCGGREDLPFAYGPGHPLRLLPKDGGVSCSEFKAR